MATTTMSTITMSTITVQTSTDSVERIAALRWHM